MSSDIGSFYDPIPTKLANKQMQNVKCNTERNAIKCDSLPYESISLDVILKDCKTLRSHPQLHRFAAMILHPTNRYDLSYRQEVII